MTCCRGVVGDVDGDGKDVPTIGDITTLVDFVFISQAPLACNLEADINQSGGLDPATNDITIGDISVLIDFLFVTGPEMKLPDCL